MRELRPVLTRSPGTWVLVMTTTLGVFFVVTVGGSLAPALSWLIPSVVGGALAADVWGGSTQASLEENAHLSGVAARRVRSSLFGLILASTVASAFVLSAAGWAVAPSSGDRAAHPATWVALLVSGPSTVALVTALTWGRSRVTALGVTAPLVLLPLMVYFGPRLTGRNLLLALSPVTAGTVVAPDARSGTVPVVLGVVVLALSWTTCAAVLSQPEPARAREPSSRRRERPARRTGRARRWPPVAALLLTSTCAMGIAPVVGEQLPYTLRVAPHIQARREQDPEWTVRKFLSLYAQGRVVSAGKLSATGDAQSVVAGLPPQFFGLARSAPLTLRRSPSIRLASGTIDVSGRTFWVCLTHPERRWLLRHVQADPCD